MLASSLIAAGSAILGLLGTVHLLYTLFTDRFEPRDAAAGAAMRATSPRLTRHTSVWSAWVGFNASHSLGAMLFGAVYGLLALAHPDWLRASPALLAVGLATCTAYLALALRYWFRTPLAGIALATLCFGAGVWLM